MAKLIEKDLPLRRLRLSRGLKTAVAAAKRISIYLPKPMKASYLVILEHRGTRNIDIIKAMSLAYCIPQHEVDNTANYGTKNNIKNSS